MSALLLESRFDLGQQVGRGAWGEVFRAVDRESGAPVAVKRLHAHLREGIALERFQREVRLLAQIQSEHVLRYVAEAVDHDGNPCLVVEWLDGEDLARKTKRARLPPNVAIDVVRQIALGLSALHDLGIVHRDVKPANVFVLAGDDDPPRVKLLDLGVARTVSEATLTEGGLAIGTPYYMAPEQATGREPVSPRTDLFSLGVMLFELVSGKRPFTGEDIFAVLAKIVLQELPRLREAVPGVPRELDAVCAKAMAKLPAERFASARELAAALALVPSFRTAATPGIDLDDEEARTITVSVALGVSGSIERRVVTAVFARLRHSDAAASDRFVAIAREHGGDAHPLLGRNFVAVFGGAKTTGDEVIRAARAALATRDAIAGVRLAISTGRALAGGAELTGDVIERGAGELERGASESEPSPVRIDAVTARLLGDELDVLELDGSLFLRGVRRASVRPTTDDPARSGARTLVGKATPCVGRDRELGMLEATFDDCVRESAARAVLVVAGAGAGKSRIRAELLDRLARKSVDPLVLVARGDSLAAGSPLGVLGRALRRHARILDGEPLVVQRAKLDDRLGRHLDPRERPKVIELLGEIASVDFRGARPRHEDAMVRGDRLRGAFEAWLAAECARRPVVLVLEDLHWGDYPTVKLVEGALRNLAESPLFVLAFARPEVKDVFPDLWADRGLLEVQLPALSKRSSADLVRTVLGARADDELVQLVVDRAEGNAFFLEELIRAVAEGGREGLPDTVAGMVQARLDALGAEPKRLLKAASVFGRSFWRGGVISLLGGAEHTSTVDGVLAQLVRREIVTWRPVSSFPGEDEYAFRHALVRESAYAMLSEDDRALGHHLAGIWLEKVGEKDPVLLAEHFERGHQPARALEWYRKGAQQALAGNDFAAAIERAERAIKSGDVSGLPLLVQAEARRWRGEHLEASRAAVAAVEALPRGDAAWFHAVREAIAANGRLGRIQIVVLWAKEASSAVAAPDALNAQIAALVPPTVHLVYAGEHERAAELASRVEALVASGAELELPVIGRVNQMRGVLAWHADEPEASIRAQHEALSAFDRGGDLRSACLTSVNLGFVLAELGQNDVAEDLLRRAHANATRVGLDTIAALALNNLGVALRNKGRLDEARAVEERAIASFAKQRDPRLEGSSRVHLAMVFAAAGHAGAAEREARGVLEAGAKGAVAITAQAALARALLLQGRAEEALVIARTANEELKAVGTIEEFDATTRLVLAEAHEARGDAEAARATIAEVVERVRAKSERLQDPTAREHMLRDVPDHARILALAAKYGV